MRSMESLRQELFHAANQLLKYTRLMRQTLSEEQDDTIKTALYLASVRMVSLQWQLKQHKAANKKHTHKKEGKDGDQ